MDKNGSKSNKKASGKSKESSDNGNGDAVQDHQVEGHDGKKYKSRAPRSHDEDDDDWGEDTSDAAVQARKEGLSSAAKNLTISDDLEKSQQERIDIFYSFVQVLSNILVD